MLLYIVLACVWKMGNSDQQSGYCSFPRYLQDVETSDSRQQRKTWISRTLYTGATDFWIRRTVVTVSGGLLRIDHLLHASCRYTRVTRCETS